MFNSIFRVAELKQAAAQLAQDFSRRLPPDAITPKNRKDATKIASAVDELYRRAAKFQRDSRLGFFKRSWFCNALEWRLREAGYSQDFIKLLIRDMLVYMVRSSGMQGKKG